jgi:beta-mannosidase
LGVIQQSLGGPWALRQVGTDDWLPALVPGGVHVDLLAAGRIPDPFVADNELRVQWVAEQDWEYVRVFRVDGAITAEDHRILVFDGLDTLADVRLNGEPLGSADNMFRSWRWDVTDLLRQGDNELSVVFRSAVRRGAELNAVRALDRPKDTLPGAPYLRKAPCHFGWDWGPKLPNIGLWKDVRLEGWSAARLEEARLTQRLKKGRAQVSAHVRVERDSSEQLAATMHIEHPDGRVETVQSVIPAGETEATLSSGISEPELWWPNDLGAQPLYRVEVELSSGDRALDRREFQIGLRTLELRREPDEWGESFTFVVNGVPVFAKGSNWIPADSFPARVSAGQLEMLLGAAARANHNMIRIWGGGYYESETFYDLCDRYGILVWHDFMFACSVYPLNDATFLANLQVEVSEQVRRLRHRACLALWCGNNEMERGWTIWGWARPDNEDLRQAYLRFFGETLPGWVADDDPETPYWPSSPSSGRPLEAPIGDRAGDEHEWVVWHELAPFASYLDSTWRFVSEFGFESLPAMATVAAFAPDPADWNLGSPMMDHHQRCRVGNARILYYLAQQFRLPMDFPSLVYLSQVLHAEAMRVGVEHWRRERARCSGALYWQLDDCWPVSSWASIDYFGRWKALHYAARRFYSPVLLSCSVEGEAVVVAITNDTPQSLQGQVRWSLERLDGEVVAAGEDAVDAAELATTRIRAVDAAAVLADADLRRSTVLVAELWHDGVRRAQVVTPFVADKLLALRRPAIELAVEPGGADRQVLVRLRSDTLARWVELTLEGAHVLLGDNYFDLPAGREVVVPFDMPEGWSLEQARDALRVRSVVDTYA